MLLSIPPFVVKKMVHVLANVDNASEAALKANEFIVVNTIDTFPQISQISMSVVQHLDSIGSFMISLVAWMIAHSM